MLKISEVAERLNLSPSKVYEIISSGKLIVHKFDGSLRVSEEDLGQYIQACRSGRQSEEPQKQSPTPRPRLKHIRT